MTHRREEHHGRQRHAGRCRSLDWVDEIDKSVLTEREKMIAQQIFKEIKTRLGFLKDVGLDYLSIDRASMTL